MISKPGFPDLSASDPARDAEPVPVIYKRGWPESTDRDKAIQDTLTEVGKLYPGREVISSEIVQSEEHVEAGEFLVKLSIL